MLVMPQAQDLEESKITTSYRMGTGPLWGRELGYAGLP